MIKNILSIAGSDPSGGAGIQADLKTFSALGCYGMAAITALTAQNTKGVTGVHELPAEFVAQQIETIFADIRVDAVKIGMVGNPEAAIAIVRLLEKYKAPHIVVDPVMIAQSGDRLISDKAIRALKRHLIPLATVVTPNIPEALVLLGDEAQGNPERDAEKLLDLGSGAVLLKGGHGTGDSSNDVYADKKQTIILNAPRIDTKNNHGTGCTLSSAIAVFLAQGFAPPDACHKAKEFLTNALHNADKLNVGTGHGPVHHFYEVWK